MLGMHDLYWQSMVCTMCHQKRDVLNLFSLIQHRVATKKEAELLVHHIELNLEDNPDFVVFKTDMNHPWHSY